MQIKTNTHTSERGGKNASNNRAGNRAGVIEQSSDRIIERSSDQPIRRGIDRAADRGIDCFRLRTVNSELCHIKSHSRGMYPSIA